MSACPICARSVAARADNRTYPFCSPRCKSIDLGKWLAEEYRVPVSDAGTEEPEDESRAPVGRPSQEEA